MDNSYYTINPGSKNGDIVIYITYYDGYEEFVPYQPLKTNTERVEERVHRHKMKKRKEKINKILGGTRL